MASCTWWAAPAAADVPPDFEERMLAEGLFAPTSAAFAPDGRIFIVTLRGRVYVVSGGRLLPQPILDISDHVNASGDRGMLGVAVDADFETNHYLYLLYTYDQGPALDDDGPETARLTRVVVRPDNTVADPESPETIVLGRDVDVLPCPEPSNELDCMPSDATTHTIGTVRADPDGTLWVGLGDASRPTFNDDRALRTYDERTYVGKIMHVDREGNGLPGHPFCPEVDDLTLVCTKLYAKGFRNPYRFSLRGGGLGPVVGDVGFSTKEEIDLVEPGRDYGWPCFEGTVQTPGWKDRPECQAYYLGAGQDAAPPVHDYDRAEGQAVVGGPLYAGGPYPDSFDGKVFVGDYGQGWIRPLDVDANPPTFARFAELTGPLDILLAPSGNVVYVGHGGFGATSGKVVEIAYCPVNCAPTAKASATPHSGPVPLSVSFDGSESSDPDGVPVTHHWDFGDGATSTAIAPQHEYASAGVYDARLTVSDGELTGTATIQITAGNSPPVPSVDVAPAGLQVTAGEPVSLEGSASDPEDGALEGARLEWQIRLHHADHIHPFDDAVGAAAQFTPAVDHDADSWYEVVLTATDSGGLAAETRLELRPRTVPLRIDSTPSGAAITYADRVVTAPFAADAAVGFQTGVSAAETFTHQGRDYRFAGWSDGAPRLRELTIPPEAVELIARYEVAAGPAPPPPAPPEPVLPGDQPLPPPLPDLGSLPPPDRVGPLITLRPRPLRAALAGTAADVSGVRSVKVALRRRRRSAAPCRWWWRELGRLARRGASCAAPRWMRAELGPTAAATPWRAALGGRLPPGRYEVLVRAVDGRGNVSRRVGGRARVALVVS